MKKVNIRKQLKAEAELHVPDPIDKIKLSAQSENLLPEVDAVCAQGNTAVKLKQRTIGLAASLAACAACCTLILTFILHSSETPAIPSRVTLSTNDIYGLGAVSTVRLLGNAMPAKALASFTALSAEDEVKSQAEKFNEYFTALDSFLGDDVVSTTTQQNTDAAYPFDIKMTINGKDFDGDTVSYTMYYTETLYKSETDDDEIENEYKLVGVMVIDGSDYRLEGERSEESEKDETETETELKIRAYADVNDKSSFVEMEQEYSEEQGERGTEYVYSVYSGGKLIEQTAVEFETETKKNKTETEYELEFVSGSGKGKYEIEREVKSGVTKMKVKYNIDGKTGVFHIREITDANGEKHYEYSYSDGFVQVF